MNTTDGAVFDLVARVIRDYRAHGGYDKRTIDHIVLSIAHEAAREFTASDATAFLTQCHVPSSH